VRTTRLDHAVELARLAFERRGQLLERGQQLVDAPVERGEVHGRREDVVRRLPHVHVVVGVDVVARKGCDDLVRVHVRARARARLKDVDRKLVVELAGRDAIGRRRDPLGQIGVEQAKLRVHPSCGCLDPAEPVRDSSGDRLAGDLKVLDRLGRLVPPERASLGRPAHAAECTQGGLPDV
jgi:hypothetical protein